MDKATEGMLSASPDGPYLVTGTPYTRPQSVSSFVFDVPPPPAPAETVTDSSRGTRSPALGLSGARFGRDDESSEPSCIVISGGTGCNAICAAFEGNTCYVLPVSDNGGSSSEIIRVLGGPSIGDIRSRLLRLIPSAPPNSASERIRRLLSYRFPIGYTEREARDAWRDIVEGRSNLWSGIPLDRKETIRGFLAYFDGEVLKRANKRFSFRNASIGNFFLTGAHLFFRSVPSAIFLMSSITGSKADILPVLVTNHTVTIAAELKNGEIIVGQCEISHPSTGQPTSYLVATASKSGTHHDHPAFEDDGSEGAQEDAIGESGVIPSSNVNYAKLEDYEYEPLRSPIERIFYINQYGQEIFPQPNPLFIKNLNTKSILVYSCGSLFTSIIPCLALRGVGSAIANSHTLQAKVLFLNGTNDRETDGFTASDYIRGISNQLNFYDSLKPDLQTPTHSRYPVSAFITHLVHLKQSTVEVDTAEVTSMGVRCIEVQGTGQYFDAHSAEEALRIIHVSYLP